MKAGLARIAAVPYAGLFWMTCAPIGFTQSAPVINRGGVMNSASYAVGMPVAPGSLVSAYGKFQIGAPAIAPGVPLPSSLSGLSLEFGGVPVPLLFVSGGQVNFQAPWELAGKSQAALIVTVGGQTSAPVMVNLAAAAPGIFTINSEGAGQGAILDASYRLVDSSNPAVAGSTAILIFCTGLGTVSHHPLSGAPAPHSPLAEASISPVVTVGGVPAQVLFSGLAPGYVGGYQVNALVPANAPLGDAVPVVLSVSGVASNSVQIAVQSLSDARASRLVSQMTLDEKIQLVHGGATPNVAMPRGAGGWVPGVLRLGIPDLYLADGSVGIGNQVGQATALPSSIASAASWDLSEAYKYGSVIGSELRSYGLNVNLGGNVNLTGREPRDGRTFETKGEDPILAGKITAAHIRAIQDQHVIGGIKHFALNDQETGRTTADAEIDERGARESDLLAFEIGVKDSNVQSVMCAYNLLNGIYSCEDPHLLTDILKGDWGFRGFVMSDWGATHSTVAAAQAGLDQEQPNGNWFGNLAQAIESGAIPESGLDDMVHRILRAMYEAGLFDYPAPISPIDTGADGAVAQEVEEQSAVLLRNAGGQLPLNAAALKSIAVIGSHADIGVLSGGGSAQVIPAGGPALNEGQPCPPCWAPVIWDPSSPLKAIQAKAPNAAVQFDPGTDPAKAAAVAKPADAAIVFVSQWTSEGMDLPSLNFTDVIHNPPIDQDALVSAVAAANPHTIVVMENGGPQVMPWLNQIAAVLEAWYPGQRGGEAIANILFGSVNPSGKLPMTFPASVADLPRPAIPTPPDSTTPFPVNYAEGFNVGYKWYDAKQITPLFPFGFGLSYTTFSFSNASLANNLTSANPNVEVSFDLANTGAVAGAEVAQVYLALPSAAGDSPKRLAGWQKVLLQPGESQHVTIEVDENDSSHPLSYWDTGSNGWRTAAGNYTVFLGNSSSSGSLITVGTFHIGE